MQAKTIGIIPSRYKSTRFPGKPLALIKGKSLIERVWRQSKKAKYLDEVYVATDDRRIRKAAESFGAKVIMTSETCKSGTDRLAQAIKKVPNVQNVINIQGDEPLISPNLIDSLAKELKKGKNVEVVTSAFPLRETKDINNPNIAKVVMDNDNFAIFFSRSTIPYNRDNIKVNYFKHIGIYGYKKNFLLNYAKWKQTELEKAEQLEQLRILQNGRKIKVVVSKKDSLGVDLPGDIKKVERLIK